MNKMFQMKDLKRPFKVKRVVLALGALDHINTKIDSEASNV
jgi:hypothetical protein